MAINPALIGKAGEMLVAGELMRRGIEVAHPASDVGVDLLAYRLAPKQTISKRFIPIQVKARSGYGYSFHKSWFTRVPGVTLVYVWHVEHHPEFYVLESIERVTEALGPVYSMAKAWTRDGAYYVGNPNAEALARMRDHLDKWERIVDQLDPLSSEPS